MTEEQLGELCLIKIMCLMREFPGLIIRLYVKAGLTAAAQFFGSLQYLLTLCLFLLTVDV